MLDTQPNRQGSQELNSKNIPSTAAMVVLIITLIMFLVLRVVIFLFIPEPGVGLHFNGTVYPLSKGSLALALWAFLGFPAIAVSMFILWERKRNRR
jgi:hypothetical protein